MAKKDEVTIVPMPNSVVPRFEISVEENRTLIQAVQKFIKEQMKENEDYGKIPGIEKPSLLKPGAEKLCNIFGFGVEVQEVDKLEDWERGIFSYTYKAIIRNKRTGLVESECIGSCNSKESKYAYRWLPEFKATQEDKDNSDRQEKRLAKSGKEFVWYRVPNTDIFSQVNTLQKMAQKRAMVGAVLIATRASGFLTQDVEDMGLDDESEEVVAIDVTPKEREVKIDEAKPKAETKPAEAKPEVKPVAIRNPDLVASVKQVAFIKRLINERDVKADDYLVSYSVNSLEELTMGQASEIITKLMAMPRNEAVDEELGF